MKARRLGQPRWSGVLNAFGTSPARVSFEVWPAAIFDFLGWLGPFIKTTDHEAYPRPDLIGTMVYGSSLRPYLLFCQHGRLSLQNLNGPGDEF